MNLIVMVEAGTASNDNQALFLLSLLWPIAIALFVDAIARHGFGFETVWGKRLNLLRKIFVVIAALNAIVLVFGPFLAIATLGPSG